MSLVWKVMIGRRHAVFQGTALCGVRSIEETGEALPCEACLDAVNRASKNAFLE